MGNSVSSISGGGGGGGNRPGNKYPLTVNTNDLLDGHYLAFYTGLEADDIVKICKSMDGVADITDLTIIIPGAYTKTKTINSKYSIKSVKYTDPSAAVSAASAETSPETTTDPKTETDVGGGAGGSGGGGSDGGGDGADGTGGSGGTETDGKQEDKTDDKSDDKTGTDSDKNKNEFGIIMDSNYYMIISTSLLSSADQTQIVFKRSIDESHEGTIMIGSKYSAYVDKYFDAYITDKFLSLVSSSNPINPTAKMKVFNELPVATTIYFTLQTFSLDKRYNARYPYALACRVTKLGPAMSHLNTVRNNANVMCIYSYDANDKFIDDAFKKYVIDDTTFVLTAGSYKVFPIGHESPDASGKTVKFKSRTIDMNTSASSSSRDFQLVPGSGGNHNIVPKDLGCGYQHRTRLFNAKDITDNVTQVFQPNQTLQLNRNDFQLYIGFIDLDTEIDILGTLINSNDLATRKFILYFKTNIYGSNYLLPRELYKLKNNLGMTNIKGLQNGINISKDFYLTLGIDEGQTTEMYDIVTVQGSSLNLKTLRKNEVISKQALLSSHTGDMKTSGAYIPDSELLLPTTYVDDKKLVVVAAVETTPSAVWNMAKNLVYKYQRKQWVLYFSLLDNYTLSKCSGFKVVDGARGMKILYPEDIPGKVNVLTDSSFEVVIGEHQTLIVSQNYINQTTRDKYISAFTVFPGQVNNSVGEYQQYKYSQVQKMSYVDYNLTDLQMNLKDNFIGGPSNTITVYANTEKFESPTIDQSRLSGRPEMYVDYFANMQSAEVMSAYLKAFENFMKLGVNAKIIKYTCLMRVRKEWIKTIPNTLYFEVIEGANKDYSLVFLFGGTDVRYTYNKGTSTFTIERYQNIILDTAKAKSNTPPSNNEIYLENPLDAVSKTEDEVFYVNGPANHSWTLVPHSITSYNRNDFLSLQLTRYEETFSRVLVPSGSVIQSDVSYTRHTFMRSDWTYFMYNLATLVKKETAQTKSNCLLFFDITTFVDTNTKMPSLTESLTQLLKKQDGSPFASFKVIYDDVNRLYTMSNIDIIINTDSKYYTFNFGRMYIHSPKNMDVTLPQGDDFLLDTVAEKFTFNGSSNLYTMTSYSIRPDSSGTPVVYPQIDKVARRATGVTVKSDNQFWNSVRAFVFISDLDKFEISNLVEMAKYLQVNLDGFYILTLVSYDTTTIEPWVFDRCVVIRGNDKSAITITNSTNNTYYYVNIKDGNFPESFMKFGLWKSERQPQTSDLTDIDFIINKYTGDPYDSTMKVYRNERISVVKDYMTFVFPDDTTKSFPKFVNFSTALNQYILFARPIPKGDLTGLTMRDAVGVLRFDLIAYFERGFDFSEIINYIVQFRTLTKNALKYVIIYLPSGSSGGILKKPDKDYTVTIDSLRYSTTDFTFTENPGVLIHPPVEFDSVSDSYKLDTNVILYNPTKNFRGSVNANQLVYHVPQTGDGVELSSGSSNIYHSVSVPNQVYLNMRITVSNLMSK